MHIAMPAAAFRRTSRLTAAAALLLAAGCADAPTGPRALQQFAGGFEWVAIDIPASLPEPEAVHADSAGVQIALGAIDQWLGRVAGEVDLREAPELAASADSVRYHRERAAAALLAGDASLAAVHVEAAATRIRRHAPENVARHVLLTLQNRLEDLPHQGPTHERAIHLVRSAREELETGDPGRALRRALYALQLAEGRAARTAPSDAVADPTCPARGCRP